MLKFNFTHEAILNLPFKTFLIYQKQLQRIADGMQEEAEIAKWRSNAEQWRRKNNNGG
jgi:hypothetical protein